MRSPESDLLLALESREWNPRSGIWNPGVESRIEEMESEIQRPSGLPHIGQNEKLLHEAGHNSKSYPEKGQCYRPKPKAETDNTDRGLDNS